MRTRHVMAVACVLVGGLIAASPASAKQLRVDDNMLDCPKATFTSIQAAVTAASPGDKVQVCAGTYAEQVRIVNKDGLKLEARGQDNPTIKAPLVMSTPNAIVHIDSSDDVAVTGFTISGPYHEQGCQGAGDDRHIGIYVDDSYDATIRHNHVTLIRNVNPALYGCQDGIAIEVGRNALGSDGSAEISQNLVDEYQKGGILVDGADASADIDHNDVTGNPLVGLITAQNGIQISRGASGQVDHNEVRDNLYTGPQQTGGTGILLFEAGAGELVVDHNDVHDNDDGISLIDTDDTRIEHNSSNDNVIYDGLYADADSTGNVFKGNDAFGNAEHDCHDDSAGNGTGGTANTWIGNKGATQNRDGLCEGATTTP